jgi:hypothetical protein
LAHLFEDALDFSITIERLATPGGWEIPPLDERPARHTKPVQRTAFFIRSHRRYAAQHAAQTRRHFSQGVLYPRIEGAGVHGRSPSLVQFFESRRNPRFDRSLAQNLRAKGVDGPDACFLQPFQRVLKVLDFRRS